MMLCEAGLPISEMGTQLGLGGVLLYMVGKDIYSKTRGRGNGAYPSAGGVEELKKKVEALPCAEHQTGLAVANNRLVNVENRLGEVLTEVKGLRQEVRKINGDNHG